MQSCWPPRAAASAWASAAPATAAREPTRVLLEQGRSASSTSPERCWIAWVSGIRPMLTLHVVTASTRDGRKGRGVAEWFLTHARAHGKFAIEDVDLAAINLPMFD